MVQERERSDYELTVLGVDVGWSQRRKSTGLAVISFGEGEIELRIRRSTAQLAELSATVEELLQRRCPDAVAIDGPLGPALHPLPEGRERGCERVLMRGRLRELCSPVDWRNPLRGRPLYEAAMAIARQINELLSAGRRTGTRPRRIKIVEAFPDAFMAVMLPLATRKDKKGSQVGSRTSRLYKTWLAGSRSAAARLLSLLTSAGATRALLHQFTQVTNKDEQSAVVCAVTALCVARGRYVTIGERATGEIVLPPLTLWQRWAIDEIHEQIRRLRREGTCVQLREYGE